MSSRGAERFAYAAYPEQVERLNSLDEENGSKILGVVDVALGMPLMSATSNAIVSASVVLVADILAEEEDIVFRSWDLS